MGLMILKGLKNSNHLVNIVFITFLLLICFLAFSNNQLSLFSMRHEDKIHHVFAFIFLSYFLHISFKNIKANLKYAALIGFALGIEVIQHFVGRQANIYDIIASISGIFLFIIIQK